MLNFNNVGAFTLPSGAMTPAQVLTNDVIKANKIDSFSLTSILALDSINAFLVRIPEITHETSEGVIYPHVALYGVADKNGTYMAPITDLNNQFGTMLSSTFFVNLLDEVTPEILLQNNVPYLSIVYVAQLQAFLMVPWELNGNDKKPYVLLWQNLIFRISTNGQTIVPQKQFVIQLNSNDTPDPDPDPQPGIETDDFLTTTQIGQVLGKTFTGFDFMVKSRLLEEGADEALMTSFGVNDFVQGRYIASGKYTTVKDTLLSISPKPIQCSLFDGNNSSEDPELGYVFDGESESAAQFAEGFEGGKRKAWKAGNGNYIRLNLIARITVTKSLTVSIVVKQLSANSGVTGVLGGVIFGNVHWGLGYALGWRPTVDGNKVNFEIYSGTGNNDGAATRLNGATALEVGKWYHIIVKAVLAGSYALIYMWINGVKTSTSQGGHNSTIGYQSLVDQTQTDKINLGRVQQSEWNYFNGMIQDFALWNSDLSDTNINKIIQYYRDHGMF